MAKEASPEPEEDEADQPAENAENGAEVSVPNTVPEKQNSVTNGTEGAEPGIHKKIRSAPSRSYLMQFIEGEKNVGKDDYDDEEAEEENSKEENENCGKIAGGKGSEEDTNNGVDVKDDDGDIPERGGRKRRRVSKEDIVNAALKKDREEREERTRVKKQRPKSPLDCLTPRERLEANNATILFSDSNPEEVGSGNTSAKHSNNEKPKADKAEKALEKEEEEEDNEEEEETFSQEQRRMKRARAQSRPLLDETSAEEGSSVIFPTEELFEEKEEDGRGGRRLVVKSSSSKRKKKLDLTGGAAKIRSPLLGNVGVDNKRQRSSVLRGKATEEPSQLSATIPLENMTNNRAASSQLSATIPLENNGVDDDEDLPDIPSSPRDVAELQTDKAMSASVLNAKEDEGEAGSGSDDSDMFEVSGTPQAKNSTFRDRVKRMSAGRKRIILNDDQRIQKGEEVRSREILSPKPPTRNSSTDSNEPATVILDKSTEIEDSDHDGGEVEMSQTAPSRGVPSTSESVAEAQRKFVLMMSGLDSKQRANVNMYAAKLGCSVKNILDASVTHVVIGHDDGMRCERTLKYFQVEIAIEVQRVQTSKYRP